MSGLAQKTIARAPRQSGLKKPRPLRSMSAQEDSSAGSTDGGKDKKAPQRLLSTGDLELDVSQGTAGTHHSPVCKEIAAMSAQLIADAGSQEANSYEQDKYNLHHQESSTFHFSGKSLDGFSGVDASASKNSYASTADAPSSQNRPTSYRGESQSTVQASNQVVKERNSPVPHILDCNSNNARAVHKNVTAKRVSFSPTVSPTEEYAENPSPGGYGAGKRGMYYRGSKGQPVATQNSEDLNRESQNVVNNHSVMCKDITVVKLDVNQGDVLVLYGRNLQKVLIATKTLLNEMNAKILKIDGVSDTEDENDSSEQAAKSSDGKKTGSSAADVKREKDVSDARSRKEPVCQRLQYSKEELLRLSTSKFSRQPPPMWNVLSTTHAGCCLPASKVTQYFDPTSFRFHDGTLVAEEHKQRERDRH